MRKDGTELARHLRRRETNAERALWQRLRDRRIDGWKFRRQVPFDRYVLDFFCFDAGLVVEVDGGNHAEAEGARRDKVRTAYLEANGLTVIRVWNGDVLNNIDGVLEVIYNALGQRQAPSPGSSRRSKASSRRSDLSPGGEAGVEREAEMPPLPPLPSGRGSG